MKNRARAFDRDWDGGSGVLMVRRKGNEDVTAEAKRVSVSDRIKAARV